jgi:hypothetical protein
LLAEQWRYRECAAQSLQRPSSVPEQVDASIYMRFAADWQARQDGRRAARARVWSQYARDVARLKRASKQRWTTVKLVAKGPIAGKLWALNARLADQRAWRRLHERHRAALSAAEAGHQPLEWRTWRRASAATSHHVPATLLHSVPGGTILDDGLRLTLSAGATHEAVAALLQLARAQYGTRLGVDGDVMFREQLAQSAGKCGPDVTFADPELEARRQQLRRQNSHDESNIHTPRSPLGAVRTGALHERKSTRQRKGRSR